MHAAFLRSICETPWDDAPRLIYADWLQEQEQEERAEFIRVQCELAGPYDKVKPSVVIRFDNLRRRERTLFIARHGGGASFLDVENTSYTLEGVEYTYERGFVSLLSATVDDYLLLVENHLLAKFPLIQVTLTDREPQPWYPEADLHDSGPQQGCYWDEWWDENGNQPIHTLARQTNRYNKHMLPKPIFDQLLAGDRINPSAFLRIKGRGCTRVAYPTLEEAMLRKSQACINFGRQRVNLPPLYTEKP